MFTRRKKLERERINILNYEKEIISKRDNKITEEEAKKIGYSVGYCVCNQ